MGSIAEEPDDSVKTISNNNNNVDPAFKTELQVQISFLLSASIKSMKNNAEFRIQRDYAWSISKFIEAFFKQWNRNQLTSSRTLDCGIRNSSRTATPLL